MESVYRARRSLARIPESLATLAVAFGLLSAAGCASSASTPMSAEPAPVENMSAEPPSPDPRVGLRAGLLDAGEAVWNMRVLSKTPSPENFLGVTNSDLAFSGNYAIQGNYNGWQIWDISNPSQPTLATAFVCPA